MIHKVFLEEEFMMMITALSVYKKQLQVQGHEQ